MDRTKLRRRNPRKGQPPHRRYLRTLLSHRRFTCEALEQRTLLAADPIVGFRLVAADPVTLSPVTELRVGEEFAMVAYVQDLRAAAQGVFSAYLDVLFPSSSFEVSGPIRHLGRFTNGTSGTAGSGIIDEVGGFTGDAQPPGGDEQILMAIPFVPRREGEFTFTADPADLQIGHEVLVHGLNERVGIDQLEFGSLTAKVLPGTVVGTQLDAVEDEFFVASLAPLTLEVLANDTAPVKSSVTIFRLDTGGTIGRASVSASNRSIQYQPPADFTGIDTFRYSVVDNRAGVDTATVTVHVENGVVTDKQARFALATTDLTGRPISAVNEGDAFLLQVRVADARSESKGVFAAYLDVSYPAQLAHVEGPLEFTGTFTNGRSGNRFVTGLIDEAGAFTSRLSPPGEGDFLLFQVPMTAVGTGHAVFRSGPADLLPDHQSLLFGDDSPLDVSRIEFGNAELLIRPAVVAVDDSFQISATGQLIALDVLGNDQSNSSSPLTIRTVDTSDLRGTIVVTGSGKGFAYTPAADSRGTEQFRYTAANEHGSSTAQVTLHLQPLAQPDDLLEIRLVTTDESGQPLQSVAAGTPFQVQAWVRDLRSAEGVRRGIYSAYLDLLYEADRAGILPAAGNPRGFDIQFGPQFQNGTSADASVAGLIDEVGAFQSNELVMGTDEQLLFTAMFQASTGRAATDYFIATEDVAAEFLVLDNDEPNQGVIRFRSDPADDAPVSDVLLIDPAEPVPASQIRFQPASIDVTAIPFEIVSVTPSRRGGKVSIVAGGQAVRYEPPPDYFGPDDFTYSLGPGSQTVVHVDVAPVNDAPAGSADLFVAGHHEPLRIGSSRGVLANDVDIDRDQLEARLISLPAHGQLQLRADGSFDYLPDSDFFGTDHFVYRAFDGRLQSPDTTVTIEVAPPAVRIRLEALGPNGQPVNEIQAGEQLVIRALVQDMRDDTRSDRGIGAVYFDLQYDAEAVQPRLDAAQPLGFDIRFGPSYQNVRRGKLSTPGRIDDVGALQSSFTPLGRDEFEVFSMNFQSLAPQVADDAYRVSKHSLVNVFDVLANEVGQAVAIQFQTAESGSSPQADVVLFEPPQPIQSEEIGFGSTTIKVRNSSKLELDSLGTSVAGGTISIDSAGRGIRYTPPPQFVGTDSFTYTVRDEHGARSTGTVTVQVVDSWSNEHLTFDANGDSFITPNDVLQIINDLNQRGGRKLPSGHTGSTFLDTNRDGHATAIDALILINFLSRSLNGASEGEAGGASRLDLDQLQPQLLASLSADQATMLSPVYDQLHSRVPDVGPGTAGERPGTRSGHHSADSVWPEQAADSAGESAGSASSRGREESRSRFGCRGEAHECSDEILADELLADLAAALAVCHQRDV